MYDWLVVTSDQEGAGRGVRGQALLWFLRTYFGRRRVGCASSQAVGRHPPAADTIFLGLPTALSAEQIERLADRARCRRLAAFDYLDQHELAWSDEQAAVLRPRIVAYLKPWFEKAWNYDLRMGMLPLRRYGRFTAALVAERALRALGVQAAKKYDVGFVGRPNFTRFRVDDRIEPTCQRYLWLSEIRREAPELSVWGGLVGVEGRHGDKLRRMYGDISPVAYSVRDKIGFVAYWREMRLSRVTLAPGGNVPWSYRHYECLYSGGVVVSSDFHQRDMLVPLPREGMLFVGDDEPVLPAVRQALVWSRERPTLGAENRAHLERYFKNGAYSRSRPLLVERFISQLE